MFPISSALKRAAVYGEDLAGTHLAIDYRLAFIALGALIVAAAWTPIYLSKRPLSLPILLVAAGVVLARAIPGFQVDPRDEHLQLTEHAAEIGVLVSLLVAGLSIDRRPGWKRWATTWRLLSIAMLLTIAGLALLGWWIIGLVPASALLLGAVIAPTDPVLASDVQVGAPAVEGAPLNREESDRCITWRMPVVKRSSNRSPRCGRRLRLPLWCLLSSTV